MALLTADAAAGEAIALACRRRGVSVEMVDVDAITGSTDATFADVLLVDLRSDGVARLGMAAARKRAGALRVVAFGDPADGRDDVRVDAWVGLDAGVADLLVAITGTERSRRLIAGASPSDDAAETLTPREREILVLLLAGMSPGATASELGIAANTVRTHLQNVISKLGVSSRAEAAAWALRAGLQPADAGREAKR